MQSNYENYPFWMIAIANALSISIYAIGFFILSELGFIFAVFYLFYFIFIEINLYRKSCVHCYYFGKLCGFGKGKICSLLFSKGDPKKFIERKLTWWDMLPDLLLLIIPFLGGIIILFLDFQWIILAAIIAIIFLSFTGNAFIRGSFSCKYCKQKELGCPAAELFSRANK
jgi:hypothetical protein